MQLTGWLVLVVSIVLCLGLPVSKKRPVVLIPGDGGSQLYAKLDKPEVVHYFCSNHTVDFFSLWLNLELLTPYVLDCTVDNLRLEFDEKTGTTSNSPGVSIRTHTFSDPFGVEWLDPSQLSVSSYFAPLVQKLVSLGYERQVNIWGAPFDFRKAPNEMDEFFVNLTALIEKSFTVNGQPALVVAHSLGNMVFTYFMSTKTQEWKDKYVSGFVVTSAPLAGAAKLFRLYASGDNLNERFISAFSVRKMLRSFPSSAFLLPYAPFWDEEHPFIITPHKNYSIGNIDVFSQDIAYPHLQTMRENTAKMVDIDKMHPGVPIYCVHGWNIQTPEQFVYEASMFPDTQPYTNYGQGDGTVNGLSLQVCDRWNTSNIMFDHKYIMKGGEHLAILASPDWISYVTSILNL